MLNILLNSRDELINLDPSKVIFFEADGNYTHVTFRNDYRTLLYVALAKIEKLLALSVQDNDKSFIRIGRKYIINRTYVFRIDIPHQRLLLSDMHRTQVYTLTLAKEALKELKLIFINNENDHAHP
ncbi:MAG: LytTR family transcriptional regulator [Prevotellaceae bacterium]|jgi:DNA-binding LytR/AlgR family response regulator|nr:LytTR family transcriptional regulator [Prevotellaceae bacterium]